MTVNCYCYLKFLFFLILHNIFLQILAQFIICTGSFYSETEIILTILPIFLSILFTSVCIDRINHSGGSLADKMSIVQLLLSA